MSGQQGFIVAALAETPLVTPGTSFSHFCSHCSKRVALAPTGQRFLTENPEVKIICIYCTPAVAFTAAEAAGLAASVDEIREELARAVPNQWRGRN